MFNRALRQSTAYHASCWPKLASHYHCRARSSGAGSNASRNDTVLEADIRNNIIHGTSLCADSYFMKVKGSPVFDVVIIGAGVIGAAIARELSKYNLQIAILERNLQVAQETSAGNSGVIHGGFDPTPGTLSAKLNLLGRHIYENEWFIVLNFPHKKVDSLVLAFNDLEKSDLKTLHDQGIASGLERDEIQILNQEQCLELEPNLNSQVAAGLF